ncbi:MFS transporter [Bartonella sp. AU15XJBT]|uniref:MFS transporter n=1 Tax=Bartonella sp. AU15XJBT TaxID=3019087 RepID=UPI00235FFFD8|nr:MFS transporter [Bartonella sp. AU15XJBT]
MEGGIARNNKFIEKYYKWIVLLVATIAQASACFFVQGIGPLAEFFKKDFSLNHSQIGLLSSAAQFLPIIGLLVAGELRDKFNERHMLALARSAFLSLFCLEQSQITIFSFWFVSHCRGIL